MRYLTGLFFLLISSMALAQSAPLYTITGTVDLRWQAPTENVDGTPLTDLCCYKVYFGQASRNYTQSLDVPGAGTTTTSFDFPLNAEGDTEWYFAMTALDNDGNESGYSNEVLKTVTVTVIDNRPPMPPVLEDVTLDLTCTGSAAEITCSISVQ